MPDKPTSSLRLKTVIFIFGFLASYVPLIAVRASWVIQAALLLFLLLSLIVPVAAWAFAGDAPRTQSRWLRDWRQLLTLSAVGLGFGAGILAYVYRFTLDRLWAYLFASFDSWLGVMRTCMDATRGLFLMSMSLFGLIMGFYVVRNWLKDEDDFLKSLRTVAGGAFLATLLGLSADALKGGNDASVGGGITMLTTFAYYAVGFTISALINLVIYAALTVVYSRAPNSGSRALIYFLYGTDKAKALDDYFVRRFEENKGSAKLLLGEALCRFRDKVLDEYAEKLELRRRAKERPAAAGVQPLHFYRLLAVGAEVKKKAQEESASSPPADPGPPEPVYEVKVEKVTDEFPVTASDFRMGITLIGPNSLEYVVAPGQFREPFPLRGSVAGLALSARQTIVIPRDAGRKFRTKDDKEGTLPPQDDRGFEEIDYLSYVSMPVVSHYGDRDESALGIINVDTKIFVTETPLDGSATVEGRRTVLRARRTLKQMRAGAALLYEQRDDAVYYLEGMRDVAIPLLELYLKCRQGAA